MSLIEIEGLKKYFPIKEGIFRKVSWLCAVDGVDLEIGKEESLGLVGESGCGKTTLGRLILRLLEPTAGTVRLMGRDIFKLSKDELRKTRCHMQMMFQDTSASLNPYKTVYQTLSKPFSIAGNETKNEIRNKVPELLELVSLTPPELFLDKYPHELSGGQKQRVVIARAISLHPEFIVCDEPVASLDMCVRAQILTLMQELRTKLSISYLFISHDLSVVRSLCQRVAVMYLGKIVELASAKELYSNPLHPYTKGLLLATPIPNPKKRANRSESLVGEVPSAINPPKGCRFCPRCLNNQPCCTTTEPRLVEISTDHSVACHLYSQ